MNFFLFWLLYNEIMAYIIKQFFIWFFIDVPKEILRAWNNFIMFYLDYFSISLLFKTLFSPWHKYAFSYSRRVNIADYAGTFFFNLMSRIIGAFLRICLIFAGLIFEIVIFIAGAIIFIGWFLLPVFIIISFLAGISITIGNF